MIKILKSWFELHWSSILVQFSKFKPQPELVLDGSINQKWIFMWSSLHKELNFHPERSAINEITHVGADRVLIHAAHTADGKKCSQQWSDEKISQSKKNKTFEIVDLGLEIMEFLLWSWVPSGEGKGNETVADGVIENFL